MNKDVRDPNRYGGTIETMAIAITLVGAVLSGLMVYDRKMMDHQFYTSIQSQLGDSTTDETLVSTRDLEQNPATESIDQEQMNSVETDGLLVSEVSHQSENHTEQVRQPIRQFHQIPQTESEIKRAYQNAKSLTCRVLPAGLPLELSHFTPMTVGHGVHAESYPAARRHAFSLAMDVNGSDQSSLPQLSKATILGYLQSHFVSIQVHVARDPVDQSYFLLPQTVAATARYSGASLSENSELATANAIKNFRSLGLYVPEQPEEKQITNPDALRTLVLIQKFSVNPSSQSKAKHDQYELAFIHLGSSAERLEIHSFVTSNHRTKIHYLKSGHRPRRFADCQIQAQIYFDEYTTGGLVPVSGIVRETQVNGKRVYAVSDLEMFLHQRNKQGTVWDHLPLVLEAMINSQG